MEPKRYKKKPVVIEAMRFVGGQTPGHGMQIAAWCGGRFNTDVKPSDHTDVRYSIAIPTLEGVMTADEGDWIIRGVQGEFYPCKPSIFDATYEAVELSDRPQHQSIKSWDGPIDRISTPGVVKP